MSLRHFTVAAALLLSSAMPVWAQAVQLQFHDGRVSMNAQNVPLRTILNEWARVGGTRIVNADRVPAGPVSIEFKDVPERQALDTLLRAASGYMAGPRQAGEPGASSFASILILPSTGAPRPATPPPPAPVFPVAQPTQQFPNGQPQFPNGQPQFPNGQRPGVRRVAPPPDPDDEPSDDVPPPEDDPDEPGARPGRIAPRGPTSQPQPFEPGDTDRPQSPATTTPGNPFGSAPVGSARPGEITPVPQPPQRPRSQPDPEP